VDEEVDEGAGGSAWPRTAGVGFPNGIRDKANDSEERKTADVKMKRKKKERKVYTDCRDIVGSHAKRSKWKKKKTESTSTSRRRPSYGRAIKAVDGIWTGEGSRGRGVKTGGSSLVKGK
jgi:hypothetical protein